MDLQRMKSRKDSENILVALSDGQIRVYQDKNLLNTIQMHE